MTDIANIGIGVDSTPVDTATKSLDNMALSATKLSNTVSETERALSNFNKAVAGGLSDQLAWSGLTETQQELLMANSNYAAQLAATNIVLTGTFNEDTIAVVENTVALKVNSLAIREMLVLPREALVGNYTRMAGSASLLAQSLGLLTAETLPLIVGFAAMAAPVIALGVAYVMGSEKVAAFNREMQLTNDYTGLTYGKFQTLAKVIGDDTGTGIGKATQALNVFIKDGNVVGENLQNWADSAVRFGQLSGESSKNAAEEMDKLAGGGLAALIKFQDQYHLLDAALIQHIAQLEATGQKEQEARDIAAGVHEAIKAKGVAELGILQAAWQGFGNLITNVWNNLENIGKNAPLEAKLAEVQNRLKPGFLDMSDVGTSFEAGDRAAIAFYQTQIDANNKVAATQSQNATVQTEAADAVGRMASEWKSVEKNTTMAAQEVAKYKADLAAMSAAHLALPSQDEQDRTIAALNKRYGNHDPKTQQGPDYTTLAIQLDDFNVKLNKTNSLYGIADPLEIKAVENTNREVDAIEKKKDAKGHYIDVQASVIATMLVEEEASLHNADANKEGLKIYQQINDAAQTYTQTLIGLAIEASRGNISQDQMVKSQKVAAQVYSDSLDPLFKFNQQMDEQIELLGFANADRAVEKQYLDAVNASLVANNGASEVQLLLMKARLQIYQQLNLADSFETANDNAGTSQANSIANEINREKNLQAVRVAAYTEIDRLRKVDVFNDQQANLAKTQANLTYLQAKLQTTDQVLTALSSLTSSKNKELAAIGKASAIIQMTIDQGIAIMKAWASAPFPANLPAVAVVTAQTIADIVKVQGLAAGGPVVGPGGPTEDRVLIAASNGEYVVNAAATAANRGTLDAINSGGQPANQNHFAAGGVVGGGGGTVMHVDFSGANFSGSDPAAIMQKVDEAMRTVYAPAIVQTSVRQSAGVQKHIAARQHINGKSR